MSSEDISNLRREEARRVTRLMDENPSFSVLRLADGEKHLIYQMQHGEGLGASDQSSDKPPSIDSCFTTSGRGLPPAYFDRMMHAYEHCGYLDFFEKRHHEKFRAIKVNRDASLARNSSPEVSQIFYDWTCFELAGWLKRHRCLFAGSESPLLEELRNDPRFVDLSAEILPKDADIHFARIRNDGRDYGNHIDEIKEDLRKVIVEKKIDTLFLSLSSAAKLICYELSHELGIRSFDFGSMGRGLTYAASPGFHSQRSSHYPYFYRVPLDIYMPAVERAYPGLSIAELLGKCHAQLCFDLQDHKPNESLSFHEANISSIKPSAESLRFFWESYRYYQQKYVPQAAGSTDARWFLRDFTQWRRKRGIGVDGAIFVQLIRLKAMVRGLISPSGCAEAR